MGRKLVRIPWDFIELKCGCTHYNENQKPYNPLMEIKSGSAGAYYDCPEEHCSNRIPPIVYEKLMDMVTELINEGKAESGYKWSSKVSRQLYEFEVFNYKPNEKIVIGIINISSKRRGGGVLGGY